MTTRYLNLIRPIFNPTWTWSSATWRQYSTDKVETLNINTNKTVTVDKPISPDDAVQPTITFYRNYTC